MSGTKQQKLVIVADNFNEHIITNSNEGIYSDFWDKIRNWLASDGINYIEEKGSFRAATTPCGTTTLFYKDKPYCMWSSLEIKFGSTDEITTTVRGEIILSKL